MKGIVLAGGTGSRLYPLTRVTNKHLLPVGRYPMIYHPVSKLAEAGIVDILIVTGPSHMGDVVGVLGSGRDFGLHFTYKVQDAAGGIAEALGLADGFIQRDESYVTVLGDNIFEDSIAPYVERFAQQGGGARILLKEVSDPNRYGVAVLDEGRIVAIEEKPKVPRSHLAVTGVYMYDHYALEVAQTLQRSDRGELEITDVNNAYIRAGSLYYDILPGWWTDAGTLVSLTAANRFAESLRLPIFDSHISVCTDHRPTEAVPRLGPNKTTPEAP